MSSLIDSLSLQLTTPENVQEYILTMSYNHEPDGETLRSAEQSLKHNTGHCLETAFVAAALLERSGYPPLILSLESQDLMDHVVFIFKQNTYWGAIGRSRETGLQGRKPVFRTIRDLMWSYYNPYIDDTSRLIGYQVFHLDETQADWRFSPLNVWRVANYLCEEKHIRLNTSDTRYKKLMRRYLSKGPLRQSELWWF